MEAELNPAQRLHTLGQSLWLDSINRVMPGVVRRGLRSEHGEAATVLTSEGVTDMDSRPDGRGYHRVSGGAHGI